MLPECTAFTRSAQGQASDIKIQAEEILKTRDRLNQLYVTHTGQLVATVEARLERDHFLTAAEAKAFGLVDEVLTKRPVAGSAQAELLRGTG